jgi:hypothetical protein
LSHTERLIFLGLFVVLAALRLARYLRLGTARRPQTGIPGTGGTPVPPPSPQSQSQPQSTTSPIAAIGGPWGSGTSLRGVLAALAVLAVGNAVVWACLFGVPALDQIPAILRLVAGVLANLFLIRAARDVAARLRTGQPDNTNNPIR